MFEIPGTAIRKVNITEEVVMGGMKPEYSEHSSARSNSSSGSGSGKGNEKYNDEQLESDGKERAVNP